MSDKLKFFLIAKEPSLDFLIAGKLPNKNFSDLVIDFQIVKVYFYILRSFSSTPCLVLAF